VVSCCNLRLYELNFFYHLNDWYLLKKASSSLADVSVSKVVYGTVKVKVPVIKHHTIKAYV